MLSQQVWDSLAPGMYIDSLAQVAHNLQPGVDDAPGSSGTQDLVDARLYVMQDASFNVLGLANPFTGKLVERYEYDAYGRRFVYQPAGGEYAKVAWLDANNNGFIDVEELDLLLANWDDTVTPYDRSRGDFNGDGVVEDDDLDLINEYFGSSGTSANDPLVLYQTGGESQKLDHAVQPGQALNDFGFQGLRHDDHTGFVNNRARWYDVDRGRFNNADPHPAIFPDGMSRYAAYHVLNGVMDPWGLESVAHWRQEVDDRLSRSLGGMDMDRRPGFDSSHGYVNENPHYVHTWYLYYALVYQEDPSKFLWAGMASQVGYRAVVPALESMEDEVCTLRTNLEESSFFRVGERVTWTIALYHLFTAQKTTIRIGRAIFRDLAWVHEAYIQDGMDELREQLNNKNITQEVYDSFELIDSGTEAGVRDGTSRLAVYEQDVIVQEHWDELWGYEADVATDMAISPIIDAEHFFDYNPDGNIVDKVDRIDWLLEELISVWNGKTRQVRSQEVSEVVRRYKLWFDCR